MAFRSGLPHRVLLHYLAYRDRVGTNSGSTMTPLTEPTVVSGNDVGFRVEWMNGRVPTGKLVIRLNGQWVEARIGEPPHEQVVPPPPTPPALAAPPPLR
jgi:hypothetical protein